MRKSMAFYFTGASLVTCTRHLMNNVIKYAQDAVGMPRRNRSAVVQELFGDAGLGSVPDVATFDAELTRLRARVICKMPDKFQQYLDNR